ncbi:MAG: hypothetical protein CVV14_08290 [Gammaproteobacteria bacterium HGW-Gammaproteobacteria-4]|nr:MAG: hypothetical protein CVV14_08290 [Gammaproteobacteria bacterium HGW-Gammaproteobacteria-4]
MWLIQRFLGAVMPAKAGIQRLSHLPKLLKSLDSSFRWNDEPRKVWLKVSAIRVSHDFAAGNRSADLVPKTRGRL